MDTHEFTNLSCGVRLLYNLNHEIIGSRLKTALRELEGQGFAFVIFSDADEFGNGNKLAEQIANCEDKRVGEVYEVGPQTNPNSDNEIRVWTWVLKSSDVEGLLRDL